MVKLYRGYGSVLVKNLSASGRHEHGRSNREIKICLISENIKLPLVLKS